MENNKNEEEIIPETEEENAENLDSGKIEKGPIGLLIFFIILLILIIAVLIVLLVL